MTQSQLINWLKAHNYSADKYGHYQKEINGKTYRYKLSKIAVRYELRADICGHNEWIRIASAYLKDLSVNDKGQLVGLKR